MGSAAEQCSVPAVVPPVHVGAFIYSREQAVLLQCRLTLVALVPTLVAESLNCDLNRVSYVITLGE